MSTITKEQAKDLRNAFQCWQQDYDPVEDKEQYDMFGLGMVAMDALLASLEAEPVALRDERSGSGGISKKPGFNDLPHGTPLYTAPPAPVSVPDYPDILPCPVILEPGLRFGKGVKTITVLEALKRRAEYYAELEAMTPEQRAHHEAGMREFAAMLQGSEPVTTACKLPFEQWLSQQTGSIDVECGCVMTEVFFHWLRVAYEAGNSPQCREISNSSTKNFRENAETSTKCWCHTCRPVTFSDSRLVVCPECGNKRCPHANDHRNACTGSNEPGQEGSAYPAAPQQEVNS